MTPGAGELRHRLVLEVASEAADGAGGATRTWTPVESVFAQVEPRRRRESVEDGRHVGLVTHRVTVRRNGSVARGARFVEGATRYRVLAVEDADPQRRFLECLCEEEQG
ncbi:phage head closure protein [Acuticoccus sp. I52.16.1]|uniref:phage head closure protein n=1 Tax=Acuticoccus sp. I52.16.1 TaxID=2928472 RepID=UPI001FD5DDAE|nr:phage head closure protein [Acuticoccus sp. I52.16.1]UOM33829.1 phage head closure protein [Acuticoccus sp. I52.16.1]